MLNNILIKLGLVKRTNEEITHLLYEFHNGIAKEVIKEDINMIEEQKTEVLLFLWLTAGVPFLYNCKNENFKNILDRNIYNILFERLKDNYDNEVFDAIYKSRRGIYNTMLKPNIPNMLFQDYLKIVNKLLFKKPFEVVSESEELKKMGLNFDFLGGMKESIYVSNIIKYVTPAYLEGLKKISKMTVK